MSTTIKVCPVCSVSWYADKPEKHMMTCFDLKDFLSRPPPYYGFVIDDRNVTFDWGHKDYWIDLDRLTKPEHLLALIAHIGKKNWEDMTPARIAALVQAFQSLRNWQRTF